MLKTSNRNIRPTIFKVNHKTNRTTALTFWCHLIFSNFSMFFEATIKLDFALLLLLLSKTTSHTKK